MDIQCLVDARSQVGESPIWHSKHNSIYWVDITGFSIQKFDLATKELRVWKFGEVVCVVALTTHPKWMLVSLGSRVILWDPATDERVDFCRPEPNWPANRLNDGATDPTGYFWIGSMKNNVAPDGTPIDISGNHGSLYRVSADGQVTVQDTGFGITNTLVWSPDRKTFYCGCSMANTIYAYDFDASTSSISNRRVFVSNLPQGVPDGSAIDSEGYLWNCRYAGHCILRISPTGKIDRVIEMPVSNITHCCFGGEDLRTLYIATSSLDVTEKCAGGLFATRVDVAGMPATPFPLKHA